MRVAVLSDIHGNDVALEAVLDDLARQDPIDQHIIAGDFFAPGPAIHSILNPLQQLPNVLFLQGNADRYLVEHSYTQVYDGPETWQVDMRHAFRWTEQRLSQAQWHFLRSLPFSHKIPLQHGLWLAVHGSPRSDEEGFTLETDADMLASMSIDPHVSLLTCGHTHVPMDKLIDGVRIVNTGSVGLPFDGDPRACYAIISNLEARTAAGIQVDLRRVEYDLNRAAEDLFAVDHPAARMGAYNIRHGQPQGNPNIYAEKTVQNDH